MPLYTEKSALAQECNANAESKNRAAYREMHPPDRQDLSIEPAPPPYQANSVKKPTILPMAPPAKPTPAPFTEIDIEEPPPPPSRTVWYNVSDHKPFYFVVMALLVMVVVGVTVPLVVIKGGGDNTQINIGAPDTPPDTPPDTTAPTSTTGTAPVSTASSATLSTPTSHPLLISTTSNLGAASVEADHNPRRLIIWQADSMELVAKDWTDKEETIYRISDQLDDLAIPLNDTALAVVNEGITHADYIHVFYVSEDAELQHIVFRDGTWERVGATDQGGPLSVHNDSQLSVAWHLRTPDDDSSAALVMLYQDQDGVLRLAVSENGPYGFDFWTTFDFARQSRDSTGPPVFSANGGLGHTIVSGWDAGRELGDGVSPVDVFLGDDGEVKLYACTVSGEEDDSSHDGLDILCLRWLAGRSPC